ncbi:MAG TPA: VWA domain-containing protein [Candidatus Deferrimicrobiaceae bacterium]|nr:VWA domain-containing protein [Candidatus Deferrimicrobiaceae bacterium]
MHRSVRFLRILVAALLLTSLSWAQNTPPTPPPQLQPRPAEPEKAPSPPASERQIKLTVQVTDKSGAPVRGLQKEDFTVLDDKRPQSILSFKAVDEPAAQNAVPPVEIVLVVDAVNASFQAVTYERNELKKFLLQNGGKLAQPVSLVIFADTGTRVQQGSSRDGNSLAALYDQYETGLRIINRSQGFYGAADRYTLSLRTLTSLVAHEGKQPGRKLMVWFSPGWPLLTGPHIEYTRKDEEGFFSSIVALSNELREADVTLYSIDPLGLADAGGVRISYYEEFLKGVPFASRAQAANLSLQVLAVQSGGRVLNSSNDITGEIAKCTADAEAFYVLSFEAAHADHANEFHAIDVKVDKPDTKARTRTGYYAQP